jgi:hypothetical protein
MRSRSLIPALVATLLLPATASAHQGTLALVNVGRGGAEVVLQAGEALKPYIGGWARQASIAAFLAGQASPGALPTGDVGRDLTLFVDRLRNRQASSMDLSDLARLLNVDYLLLLRVGATHCTARLFSLGRQAYAPVSFEASRHDVGALRQYVQRQTGAASPPVEKPAPRRRWVKWVLWGGAAALGGLTLGLALSQRNDTSGDLRIRVTR